MLSLPFIKATALGNDFVILDARKKNLSLTQLQIQKLVNRREGVGCDQVIVLKPPQHVQADVKLEFYNADGSQAEACGNGTRCVAYILMEERSKDSLQIETEKILHYAHRVLDKSKSVISITMGKPRFDWTDIPLVTPKALKDVIYQDQSPFCVNVGNPHAVFFVHDVQSVPISTIGPQIENHKAFPKRTNVGFAEVLDNQTLSLRVWERGAGYTLACGTGACAAAVIAIKKGLTQTPVRTIQEGGDLTIDWKEEGEIIMIGSARIVFWGSHLSV